jgi:hypothetical protein
MLLTYISNYIGDFVVLPFVSGRALARFCVNKKMGFSRSFESQIPYRFC